MHTPRKLGAQSAKAKSAPSRDSQLGSGDRIDDNERSSVPQVSGDATRVPPQHPDIAVGEIRSTGLQNLAWLISLDGCWFYATTRELHAGPHTGRMAKFCTEKLGIWPQRIPAESWRQIVNDRLARQDDAL